MAPLHGIGVLVTRPEQQASPLCGLLEAQGAITLRLPAIEIQPLPESCARISALDGFDIILFASANAVRHGAAALAHTHTATLGAIGPATARALRERGYEVTLQPEGSYTSEALLANPMLEQLAGKRVLLIKGAAGRQVLDAELSRRGASVVAVDVYRRVPASPSAAELAAVHLEFVSGRLRVITATSLEVGHRLLDFAKDELRAQFQQALWLVPGERVAAGLRDLGLHAPMLAAASAEDQDLVSALVRWRSSESKE